MGSQSKRKRNLFLILTIVSMIAALISLFFVFAYWNEVFLQDAIRNRQVKIQIHGVAENNSFSQPMLRIRFSKNTYLPLTVKIPPGFTLNTASGESDLVLPRQKVTLFGSQPVPKDLFAYSLDYTKSFPNQSTEYHRGQEIIDNDELIEVLDNIVAMESKSDFASQIAVWIVFQSVEEEELKAAVGIDISEPYLRAEEIVSHDPLPIAPLFAPWLSLGGFLLFSGLSVILAWLSWLNAPKKRVIDCLDNWRLLARGGMAEVWLAEDKRAGKNQNVVVKFPRRDTDGVSPQNIEYRFETEIQIHQQLDHPHIVKFIESGECLHPRDKHQTRYLVQEFVDGSTLYQIMFGRGFQKLDDLVILRIIEQITDALRYIHQREILHRDLTWKNIMVSGKHIYLIDFGNATKFGSDITAERGLPPLGTPPFHAPLKMIKNEPARDFYALAMLIYAMYAGRNVTLLKEWEAASRLKELYENLNGVPRAVRRALEWPLKEDYEYSSTNFRDQLELPGDILRNILRHADQKEAKPPSRPNLSAEEYEYENDETDPVK